MGLTSTWYTGMLDHMHENIHEECMLSFQWHVLFIVLNILIALYGY